VSWPAAWQDISAAFSAVQANEWALVLLGILLPIPLAYFPQAKQAYHQWTLDRRLARDPVIYQEELNEYEYKIGEDLDEVDWRAILWSGIGNALIIAGLIVFQKIESEWSLYLILGVLAVLMIVGFRAHYRDAETKGDEPYSRPLNEYPPEAIWGLAGGLFFAFAMVMFAMTIF
jgi:hypothetical protein